MPVTGKLVSWSRFTSDTWPTLLLGNGFSMNLWDGFSYKSLFDNAFFTPPADALFAELDTTNFEQVLECIHHAKLTEDALGTKTQRTVALYDEVRDTLFEEVTDSHVDWNDIGKTRFDAIAAGVLAHDKVFSTNYDLTMYWSMLQGAKSSTWGDLFWNPGAVFDRLNADRFDDRRTLVFYLHGAIHLWRNRAGVCGKWTSDQTNLLDVLNNYSATSNKQPMFVSEGTSRLTPQTRQHPPQRVPHLLPHRTRRRRLQHGRVGPRTRPRRPPRPQGTQPRPTAPHRRLHAPRPDGEEDPGGKGTHHRRTPPPTRRVLRLHHPPARRRDTSHPLTSRPPAAIDVACVRCGSPRIVEGFAMRLPGREPRCSRS